MLNPSGLFLVPAAIVCDLFFKGLISHWRVLLILAEDDVRGICTSDLMHEASRPSPVYAGGLLNYYKQKR